MGNGGCEINFRWRFFACPLKVCLCPLVGVALCMPGVPGVRHSRPKGHRFARSWHRHMFRCPTCASDLALPPCLDSTQIVSIYPILRMNDELCLATSKFAVWRAKLSIFPCDNHRLRRESLGVCNPVHSLGLIPPLRHGSVRNTRRGINHAMT